jgi:hypothetical protein
VAPLSGLAFAVLFGLGSGLWALEQPERGAETAEIVAFFEDTSVQILIGGTMSIISLVFLVWFGSIVHERLAEAGGSRRSGLPLLAFGGTVLTAAVGFGAETINMAAALSAEDGQLTSEGAQLYFDLTYAFGAHAAGITIAMVALPIGLTAFRTEGLLPKWAGWVALVFGTAMLTPAILNRVAFLVLYSLTVLLFAAFSIYIQRTTPTEIVGLRV